MRILTKDITIGDGRYQLVKMPADTACWINNLLVAVMMKSQTGTNAETNPEQEAELAKLSPEERANGLVAVLWLNAAVELSEEAYKRVQNRALMACRAYDANGALSVVLMPDGRWATKGLPVDLAQDGKTVNELVTEAIRFNIAPFFTPAESSEAPGTAGQP